MAGVDCVVPPYTFISDALCKSNVKSSSSASVCSSEGISSPPLDEDVEDCADSSPSCITSWRISKLVICGLISLPPRVDVVRYRLTEARSAKMGLDLDERNKDESGLESFFARLRNKTRGRFGESVENCAPERVYNW